MGQSSRALSPLQDWTLMPLPFGDRRPSAASVYTVRPPPRIHDHLLHLVITSPFISNRDELADLD